MSAEHNKQRVRDWFDAVNKGDEQAILGMLTEDFRFISMARLPKRMQHDWGPAQFAAAPKAMSGVMKAPIVMKIEGMIAEGDKVAVEASTDSELKNGKIYDNAYHFVFAVRGEKISSVREYCCSHLVEYCFGEYNPTTDGPSPAA